MKYYLGRRMQSSSRCFELRQTIVCDVRKVMLHIVLLTLAWALLGTSILSDHARAFDLSDLGELEEALFELTDFDDALVYRIPSNYTYFLRDDVARRMLAEEVVSIEPSADPPFYTLFVFIPFDSVDGSILVQLAERSLKAVSFHNAWNHDGIEYQSSEFVYDIVPLYDFVDSLGTAREFTGRLIIARNPASPTWRISRFGELASSEFGTQSVFSIFNLQLSRRWSDHFEFLIRDTLEVAVSEGKWLYVQERFPELHREGDVVFNTEADLIVYVGTLPHLGFSEAVEFCEDLNVQGFSDWYLGNHADLRSFLIPDALGRMKDTPDRELYFEAFAVPRRNGVLLADSTGDSRNPYLAYMPDYPENLGYPPDGLARLAASNGFGNPFCVMGMSLPLLSPETIAALPPLPDGVFRDCPVCPEMVVISSGSFTMGSPESEPGRDDDEGPQHQVTIGYSFAMGRYELTFAEWDACQVDGGCTHRPDDRGWGRGDRPVINVSWNDAQEYLRWISDRSGRACRLPSEAEWEYAARAGTTTAYAFGDQITTSHATFRRAVGPTTEVGSYPANSWGLHDMHGNVWEWVEDCRHGSLAAAPADGGAWLDENGGNCEQRMRRGGSFNSPDGGRVADRNWFPPRDRFSYVGFRIVCSTP